MTNKNRGDCKMEREMNLLEIIQAFIKRFRLVMVIVILFGILGGGASLLMNELEYNSSATLIVGEETQKETDRLNPINGEPIYETVIQFGSSSISEQSKNFYMETLQRRDLLTEVVENLDLPLTPIELSQKIKMEVPENSSSIIISVGLLNYKEVDQIVNEITDVFINKVNEITEVEKIKILDSASEPTLVNNVNYTRNIVIAILAGLGVSFVLVLVLEYFDDSIDFVGDIDKKLGLEVIGELQSREELHENLKTIRTKLEYSPRLKYKKAILLTPVDNSYLDISSDLSKVLGEAGAEVLLIDADLREPSIHKEFDLSNESGLSDVLDGKTTLNKSIRELENNVQVLTAGSSLERPSEKLSTNTMKDLLANIKDTYEYIIVKGHQINNVTDSLALSTATEGVILLVQENVTKKSEIIRVKKLLADIDTEIIGVIYSKIKAN